MKNLSEIRLLMTGIGAPGAPGIIKSLRHNQERNIFIVGVDSDLEGAIGKGLVDKSYSIPQASDPNFIQELLIISRNEKVSIILPLVTKELFIFSKAKPMFDKIGINVIISNYEKLNIANNKYTLMVHCKDIGIPVPSFRLVGNLKEFITACTLLGYPKKRICFKPPLSNGLRGFRIVNDTEDKMNNLINEKPNNVYIGYDEFISIARDSSFFPELLVMEYLPGKEYSVDALGDGNKCIKVIPRSRDKIKMGISFVGTTIEDNRIIEYSSKIVESLKLFGNIGFQFREDENGIPKIIESNPRVQGTIVLCTASGYNMVYNAVKIALGEKPIDYQIKWNTKMVRFWDELYFRNQEVFRLE